MKNPVGETKSEIKIAVQDTLDKLLSIICICNRMSPRAIKE